MLSTRHWLSLRAVMLLSAITAAWCDRLWARAALKTLRRSPAQHCSTATRQGSGNASSMGAGLGILWQGAAGVTAAEDGAHQAE
jgi:hypothetical protein